MVRQAVSSSSYVRNSDRAKRVVVDVGDLGIWGSGPVYWTQSGSKRARNVFSTQARDSPGPKRGMGSIKGHCTALFLVSERESPVRPLGTYRCGNWVQWREISFGNAEGMTAQGPIATMAECWGARSRESRTRGRATGGVKKSRGNVGLEGNEERGGEEEENRREQSYE
jgi:hypothetical protein